MILLEIQSKVLTVFFVLSIFNKQVRQDNYNILLILLACTERTFLKWLKEYPRAIEIYSLSTSTIVG